MRLSKLAIATGIALSLVFSPVDAAPKGSKSSSAKASAPKGQKAPKTTTAGAPKGGGKSPKATQVTTTTTTTKAPKSPAPKSAAKAEAKLAKSNAKSVKKSGTTTAAATTTTGTTATDTTTSGTGTTSTTPTSSTTGSTTASTIDFTKGAVAEKLTKNANLRSKIESRLQAAGYEGNVYQAAYGFRNQGQFIAATNVSQNLGIPFEQLKLAMTGLSVDADGVVMRANLAPTGTVTLVPLADAKNPAPTKSLGQAIQSANSTVNATTTANTAIQQANAEVAATSGQ